MQITEEKLNQYNSQGQKHGYWEEYKDRPFWQKGNYENNKKHGYWENYYDNSEIKYKTFYF
jgi:antitoxin component YwqK of YwqJK toxin-antitoxin module